MNEIYFPEDPAGVFHSMPTLEFAASWAGQNPLGEGFCFGSETGELVLTDTLGNPVAALGEATESKEAVNGVAFSQNWIAVTTRSDINFIGPWLRGGREQRGVVIYESALDVVVAPLSGQFIIPTGPAGIMFVKPGITDKDSVTVSRSDKASLNFSRLLALSGPAGQDLIVCAARRGGLGFADFREGMPEHTLNSAQFHSLDLVDVCSMGGLAVAAAAKDGSLVLFRNILAERNPTMVKFKGVQGTVYRLLYARGEIFILTSQGLYGLFGLANQFLNVAANREFNTEILRIPIQASDANVVREKWLLAVGIDWIFRFDLEKMPKSSEQQGLREEPEDIGEEPLWKESGFEQRDVAMV